MNQYQEQERRRTDKIRSVMDFAMGTFCVLLGIYFFTYEKLGITIFKSKPSDIDYFFGGFFCLYGGWRIYRGYKKIANK
jgi:hypothetical protein